MTLSRFLRDYLYIPLGGSRHGKFRRYLNLFTTMLLGGLWHGAGWTFVIWGALHGFYLMINHAWRGFKEKMGWGNGGLMAKLGAGTLTFLAVVIGWVFFRADSFSSAITMLHGMAGMNGVSLPKSLTGKLGQYFVGQDWVVFEGVKVEIKKAGMILSLGFLIIWFLPNVREIFSRYRPTCEDMNNTNKALIANLVHKFDIALEWKATTGNMLATAFLLALSIMGLTQVSEFLYFQF